MTNGVTFFLELHLNTDLGSRIIYYSFTRLTRFKFMCVTKITSNILFIYSLKQKIDHLPTHEKDYLPIQNLEDKEASGTSNRNLYKNSKIKYLFYSYMLSVTFFFILSSMQPILLSITSNNSFNFLFVFVSCMKDSFHLLYLMDII